MKILAIVKNDDIPIGYFVANDDNSYFTYYDTLKRGSDIMRYICFSEEPITEVRTIELLDQELDEQCYYSLDTYKGFWNRASRVAPLIMKGE